jgi:hypothetical protein
VRLPLLAALALVLTGSLGYADSSGNGYDVTEYVSVYTPVGGGVLLEGINSAAGMRNTELEPFANSDGLNMQLSFKLEKPTSSGENVFQMREDLTPDSDQDSGRTVYLEFQNPGGGSNVLNIYFRYLRGDETYSGASGQFGVFGGFNWAIDHTLEIAVDASDPTHVLINLDGSNSNVLIDEASEDFDEIFFGPITVGGDLSAIDDGGDDCECTGFEFGKTKITYYDFQLWNNPDQSGDSVYHYTFDEEISIGGDAACTSNVEAPTAFVEPLVMAVTPALMMVAVLLQLVLLLAKKGGLFMLPLVALLFIGFQSSPVQAADCPVGGTALSNTLAFIVVPLVFLFAIAGLVFWVVRSRR